MAILLAKGLVLYDFIARHADFRKKKQTVILYDLKGNISCTHVEIKARKLQNNSKLRRLMQRNAKIKPLPSAYLYQSDSCKNSSPARNCVKCDGFLHFVSHTGNDSKSIKAVAAKPLMVHDRGGSSIVSKILVGIAIIHEIEISIISIIHTVTVALEGPLNLYVHIFIYIYTLLCIYI